MTAGRVGSPPWALVVGLGHPDRADDAVGVAVADRLAGLALPGVTVTPSTTPDRLLELWEGRDTVVVVDAVRSGGTPGSVRVLQVDELPAGRTATSSHGVGLAEAVALGRQLGRLPRRLVVVGVEAEPGAARPGDGLSPAVRAAVPLAADRVAALVGAG